jgi:hypothetical protein
VAGVRHAERRTFVLSSRLCSVMEILPRVLIHVLLVIERALFGLHATRRSVRTIADVCDVCVPERETYPTDVQIDRTGGVYNGPNKRSNQGWHRSSIPTRS